MNNKREELIRDVKSYLYEDESVIKMPKKRKNVIPKASKPLKPVFDHLDQPTEPIVQPVPVQVQEPNLVSPILKEESLPDTPIYHLMKQLHNCHSCALARTRHNVVVGSGNPESMLYIIGEAPGQEEDLQGEPFIGRSGQLLTRMLEAIAINRKDIFITNIVKCRPPNNRDPLPDEIASCSPYIKQQITLGKPKVLLALGRYSTGFLLNDFKASLSSFRGGLHSSEYGQVLVTYHPAAVLRSPNVRKPMVWEDLKFLAQYLLKEGFYNPEQIEILKKNKALDD